MKIGIAGIGKLGLCFALNLDRCGFNVIGFDINKKYINDLKTKNFNSPEIYVNSLLASSHVGFTSEISEILICDIIFIFVNTPSNFDGSFNHDQIDSVLSKLECFKKTIVVCSTVMPGYCESLNDERLVYNPQFISQGRIIEDQISPDLILIGTKCKSHSVIIKNIYKKLCSKCNFKEMDFLSAEIAKLALNCYITTKISFANSLGDICKASGASCEDVLSALADDSRIGGKCFKYGYGYGGPCFPRDNKAFILFAKNFFDPYLNIATEKTNDEHLNQQLKLIEKGIFPENVEFEKGEFIIKNVAFKKDSILLDESQQLKFALELSKKYTVVLRDKVEIINKVEEKYGKTFKYEAIK